jgi:putative transposon-encoded protein
MVKKEKPTITRKLIQGDKIIEMEIKRKVGKLGLRSGYVALPKELIGKYVTINYKSDNADK